MICFVGTDNVGKLGYNMELSKKRAEAVVKEYGSIPLIQRGGLWPLLYPMGLASWTFM